MPRIALADVEVPPVLLAAKLHLISFAEGNNGLAVSKRQFRPNELYPSMPAGKLRNRYARALRANAEKLAAFRAEHVRWPAAKAHDPAEAYSGCWLAAQRSAARGKDCIMSTGRRSLLDQVVPGWLVPDRQYYQSKADMRQITRDPRWYELADQVLAFYWDLGRWPAKSAANAHERRLGIWLTAQRQLANPESALSKQGLPLRADRLAYLTEAEPSWLDSRAHRTRP